MLSGWKQFGLVVTALLAMLLTAKLFARTELTAQVKSSQASQRLNRRPRELAFFRPFGA
jgi:hypothetical protein